MFFPSPLRRLKCQVDFPLSQYSPHSCQKIGKYSKEKRGNKDLKKFDTSPIRIDEGVLESYRGFVPVYCVMNNHHFEMSPAPIKDLSTILENSLRWYLSTKNKQIKQHHSWNRGGTSPKDLHEFHLTPMPLHAKNVPGTQRWQRWQDEHLSAQITVKTWSMWMFPKIGVGPPNHPFW